MAQELKKLTVVKLRARLKKKGLNTRGRKTDLIARLMQNPEAEVRGAEANNEEQAPPHQKIAEAFRITGATGNNADNINGHYALVKGLTRSKSKGLIVNGMPLYQKTGKGDRWLRMARNGKWHVSSTKNKNENSNRGFCVTKEKHPLPPSTPTIWKVWNQRRWEEQASVSVVPLSPETWRKEERKLRHERHKEQGDRNASACAPAQRVKVSSTSSPKAVAGLTKKPDEAVVQKAMLHSFQYVCMSVPVGMYFCECLCACGHSLAFFTTSFNAMAARRS